MVNKEEKIKNEFNEEMGNLTDKQFWAYISGWFDEDLILDIMNNWDVETKEIAIKEMRKIRRSVK